MQKNTYSTSDKAKILALFKDLITVINQSIPLQISDNQLQRQKKVAKGLNINTNTNVITSTNGNNIFGINSHSNDIPQIHELISANQSQRAAKLTSPKMKKARSGRIPKKKQKQDAQSEQLYKHAPEQNLKRFSFHQLPESSQHHMVNFSKQQKKANVDLSERLKEQIFWNYPLVFQYNIDQFSENQQEGYKQEVCKQFCNQNTEKKDDCFDKAEPQNKSQAKLIEQALIQNGLSKEFKEKMVQQKLESEQSKPEQADLIKNGQIAIQIQQ